MGIPERRARLLVVDDEPLILRSVQRILHEYDLVCVDDAREAMKRIADGEAFDATT